ncbi:unnamed protein product, partial [Ectocarpus sp. 12 AP-2014]
MAAVVWVYCLVWFLVQDAAKVATIRLMERSNQFDTGHNTSHKRVYPGSHIDESSHGRHNRSNNKKSLSHSSRHRKINEQRVQLPS